MSDEQQLASIAVHEAGHAVVAVALGGGVSRVFIEKLGRTPRGAAIINATGLPTVARIAVLIGGSLAQRHFSYLKFPPPAPPVKRERRPSRREAKALHEYHYMRPRRYRDDPDDLGGDGGEIGRLLQGLPDADAVYGGGERLALQALDVNDRMLFRLAKSLLAVGELQGETLAGLLAEIHHVEVSAKVLPPKP